MLYTSFRNYLANSLRVVLRTGMRYHHCDAPSIVMNNGNEMPIIGLGTWSSTRDYILLEHANQKVDSQLDSEYQKKNSADVMNAVGWAIDAGYKHIDCAHLYKNQREIGQVINKKIENKVISRGDLFITSKLWNTFHDPKNVCSACQQTLKDFNLKYLDMYLIHTPMGFQHSNDLFPVSEGKLLSSDDDYIDTWHAMEELVENKMCKNIGISNFNIQQIKRLLKNCKIVPQTLQIEVHPYLTQQKLINFAKCNDICITAYAPVGSPKRPWAEAKEERTLLTDYKILQLAEKHKRTPAQILMRYQVQCSHAVIPKSNQRKHIVENIEIFDFELSPEDVRNIESLNHNVRYFEFKGLLYIHMHVNTLSRLAVLEKNGVTNSNNTRWWKHIQLLKFDHPTNAKCSSCHISNVTYKLIKLQSSSHAHSKKI